MKIQELRVIAKARGIKTARMRKGDIIQAIQQDEGNFVCFGTAADGYCDQYECAWREDCLPEPAVCPSA
ncbi:MAG: Rho termination factor N-terminal domain-containing protein [Deltaproteobacteria bacterium]|nr:Rho termination factor N-terminal domain-containing protein [Deltaproteobacteria bacterium]